jgi:hypothetical protein
MSRGNCIVLTAEPRGEFVEGIVGAGLTPKPGTAMQIDHSVGLIGGVHTWKLYDRAADGDRPLGPIIILRENYLYGGDMTTAYAAGQRAYGYIPLAGDQLNLLLGDVSGTGDAHTIGEQLTIDDGTGVFIVTAGTPEIEPAVLCEAVAAPTSDTLAWCRWSGY